MSPMIFPGQVLYVPGEEYISQTQRRSSLPCADTRHPASRQHRRQSASTSESSSKSGGNSRRPSTDVTVSSSTLLFASQILYLGHSEQRQRVTGMLTIYGDEVRFDAAVQRGCSDTECNCLRFSKDMISVSISAEKPSAISDQQHESGVVVTCTSDVTADADVTQQVRCDFKIGADDVIDPSSSTSLDFDTHAVQYVTVKLSLASRSALDQPSRPTISHFIQSFLPTSEFTEHYFALPHDRVCDMKEVIINWSTAGENSEVSDVVQPEITSTDRHKRRSKPAYRRTLSAAELYNLPLPDLSHPSSIFTDTHIRTLREHLPARADGKSWQLVYSTERDGFSLSTLYRRMVSEEVHNSPVLLLIRDSQLHIFGAMMPNEPRISDCFYGNGELFIFTFSPTFKKYRWSGKNNYFLKGDTDSFTIGLSDGMFGLWLDDSLFRGRTDACQTFDSEPLTDSSEFVIEAVEAWAFP